MHIPSKWLFWRTSFINFQISAFLRTAGVFGLGLARGLVGAQVVATAGVVEVGIDCVGSFGTTIIVVAGGATGAGGAAGVKVVVAVGLDLALGAAEVVGTGLGLALAGILGFSVDGVGTGRGTGDGGGTSGC